MARGVFNWSFRDVVAVLTKHGFARHHIDSSHHFYIKFVDGRLYQVQVPYHGNKAFKPRTLKGMILQSGLSKEDWGI